MALCPWLWSPFTDLTSTLLSHQFKGRCADFELQVMECMQAYGLERGIRECDTLVKDFMECHNRQKQHDRHNAMQAERNRQYSSGERKEKYAESPRVDAW